MQKLFLMGEKIFIGAETINPLQKVVPEELGVARQDNRANRRARSLRCRGRVRPRRMRLSKVVDVVPNTNNADGQLAKTTYGDGRAGAPRTPQTETFQWDGLALIQRGDEQFINEPHIGGGNPVASSKGTSYFNDALGTTVGAKKDGKYSAAALTAFGENLSVDSPTPTQNSNFFTGKPYVEGLGHAFWMRNYRAGLAKWQTADPLGYPDGWNQLAYCGNGVTRNVDFMGCATVPPMPSPDDVANYRAMYVDSESTFSDVNKATEAKKESALETFGGVTTREEIVGTFTRTGRMNVVVGEWEQVVEGYDYYWKRTTTWDNYERIYRLTRLYLIFPKGKVELFINDVNLVTSFSPDLVGNIVNKGTTVYLYFKEEKREFLGYKYKLISEKLTPDSNVEYHWGSRPE